MRPRSPTVAVPAALAAALLAACATGYYYIDSESFVREGVDLRRYKTAAILYFGYTSGSTVVEPDTSRLATVGRRSPRLVEQDVIQVSNALIGELSAAGLTLVERNRVNDLIREQGLVGNELVDLSDLEKVRRIGKLLKADLLIKGTVFTQIGGLQMDADDEVYHVALVGLAVRAIDSGTGEIVWSDVTTAAARRVPEELGDDYSLSSDYALIRQMVHAMVQRFVRGQRAANAVPGAAPGAADACPDRAEDADGFADGDGCPDPDNDRDGLPDASDACPDQAEDADGFADGDGCPDPDNDRDGVPDASDACRDRAEDADGFADADGCPDPDNDGDLIPDAADGCPGEAEVLNGDADGDGCPDAGAALVAIESGMLVPARKLEFKGGKQPEVAAKSRPALDVVAGVLARDPALGLRIEGYTDAKGDRARNVELSRRRAEAVKRYLVGRGIDGARIEAKGRGPDDPIAVERTRQGREMNRRVELHLVGP